MVDRGILFCFPSFLLCFVYIYRVICVSSAGEIWFFYDMILIRDVTVTTLYQRRLHLMPSCD